MPAKSAPLDATPIQLSRHLSKPALPPEPGRQYLKQHELDLARRHFEAELRRDPRQLDALLALAAIALRQQRAGDAKLLYRQALIAHPGDPNVLAAALNGSSAGADQPATESRLKILLSTHPAVASLHFSLGNLHARQGRWHEAQQAYFNAVTMEASNPDYLFNLAVSLDHIRQARAAAQYYQQAINATTHQPGAFDHAQVQNRLRELLAEAGP
jgi:Tfp pilus assembly protein PilF